LILYDGSNSIKYNNVNITAKIRYASKPIDAILNILENGLIETVFESAQRAVTPGQSIVFYRDDLVIGGGIIV
jgi:tRNA-specific 2-thiouridylase